MKKLVMFLVMIGFIMSFLAAQQNNNMVGINGGTFTMGSPANEPSRESNEVQRQVPSFCASGIHQSRFLERLSWLPACAPLSFAECRAAA